MLEFKTIHALITRYLNDTIGRMRSDQRGSNTTEMAVIVAAVLAAAIALTVIILAVINKYADKIN